MLGLGNYNHFEAQLPMALEAIIVDGIEEYYDFELQSIAGKPLQLDLRKMIVQIITDIQKDNPSGVISVKFHNTLVNALLQIATIARESQNLNTVALSGGVFCNHYLTNRLIKLLQKNSFLVLFNRNVPSNDGGISLGQAAIAAKLTNSEP
jgi:hydrogenase maturation protein HypF